MFTGEVLDVLNRPIKPGDKILYATSQGSSSPKLTLARVVELREVPATAYRNARVKIAARRIREGKTRFLPKGHPEYSEWRCADRIVLLQDAQRMVVVHPEAE